MTPKRRQYLKDKLYEMYTLLYKAATPSIDFMELVKNSSWIRRNMYPSEYYTMSKEEQEKFRETFEYETILPADSMTEEEAIQKGFQRKIEYDKYYLDRDEYDKIVNDFINDKKNKFSKIEKSQFRTEAYLGCGPTSAHHDPKQIKIANEFYEAKER